MCNNNSISDHDDNADDNGSMNKWGNMSNARNNNFDRGKNRQ